jgi:hypothetical protein
MRLKWKYTDTAILALTGQNDCDVMQDDFTMAYPDEIAARGSQREYVVKINSSEAVEFTVKLNDVPEPETCFLMGSPSDAVMLAAYLEESTVPILR